MSKFTKITEYDSEGQVVKVTEITEADPSPIKINPLPYVGDVPYYPSKIDCGQVTSIDPSKIQVMNGL